MLHSNVALPLSHCCSLEAVLKTKLRQSRARGTSDAQQSATSNGKRALLTTARVKMTRCLCISMVRASHPWNAIVARRCCILRMHTFSCCFALIATAVRLAQHWNWISSVPRRHLCIALSTSRSPARVPEQAHAHNRLVQRLPLYSVMVDVYRTMKKE